MNHGREKGSRKKPVKSRREGYTGARKQRMEEERERERILKEKRAKTSSEFIDWLRQKTRRQDIGRVK